MRSLALWTGPAAIGRPCGSSRDSEPPRGVLGPGVLADRVDRQIRDQPLIAQHIEAETSEVDTKEKLESRCSRDTVRSWGDRRIVPPKVASSATQAEAQAKRGLAANWATLAGTEVDQRETRPTPRRPAGQAGRHLWWGERLARVCLPASPEGARMGAALAKIRQLRTISPSDRGRG